jgi:phosphotransferase system enzyme I (PtsI)
MIASTWEVRACRQVCQRVMEELERDGIPFRRDVPLGIMIETPAAVFLAEELAREADFFCLGTNDLAQYTLACDREGGHLDAYRPPHHPAVLKAVRMTADAARSAGIPVSICGELAADESLLPDFLDMGIGALSVSPARVLPLRAALRTL